MTPEERLALIRKLRDEMEEFIARLGELNRMCEEIAMEAEG